ncbi:MAG: ArsR/SmtB family transcription factor [Candidatus Freyarchaeota archaeon]|nr:winged helix-turn-helix domain-containing protein [Candidatus Freyrarchaeum guaymaensis]
MPRRAVVVLSDPESIHIMSDPMRKEILRLLLKKPMTETELSEALGINKSSVGYHLKILREYGIISVQRSVVGEHGILQKYYEPTATLFVVDYDKAPLKIKKQYIEVQLERLRGIISLFQMVEVGRGRYLQVSSDLMEELAEEMVKNIVAVSRKYEGKETDLDGETFLTLIYGEALNELMKNEKWKKFFASLGALGKLIVKTLPNEATITS